MEPIYEEWKSIVEDYNAHSPSGVNNIKISGGRFLAWLATEGALVRSALMGLAIATTFAFGILLISTNNLHISIFSTLSIGGILACVLSVMEMNKMELGTAETIAIVILVGFSVDYVVHLGNHYVECDKETRKERMDEALKHIGVSILSGALTTLGSVFFLFFATLSLFAKFGLVFTVTIAYSLLFSLFFFTALCYTFGPEGDSGNIGM